MVKRSLTDAAVKRLRLPDSGQIDIFDQGFPGLALRLSYGGRRSWVFFYRIGRKLRRMTLGTYPALSLAEARDAWRIARTAAQEGRDPASERKQETGATDFENVLREWLKRDQGGNRSVDAVKRLVEKDALPAWQYRQIGNIGRRDILDVIDSVVDRGSPITARRLHAHLHRLFKWSVGRGIIEANPMADMPKPGAETKRERVLSDAELKACWAAASTMGWPFGPAVQLLILTGARRQEIAGLRWSEIIAAGPPAVKNAAESQTISLSGERTKNGEPHTIPLSKPALAVIEGLPRVADSDFVFTTNGRTSISGWSKAKRELDEKIAGENSPRAPSGAASIKASQKTNGEKSPVAPNGAWTLHDIRRTVATGLQKLGISLQVIEAVLGHTSGSRAGVVGIYQRHSFDKEKAAALEAWGAHVMALVEGKKPGKVVAIRGKR